MKIIVLSETTRPRYVDLYKFVQIMPLWPKVGALCFTSMLKYGKHEIFLSENTRTRALICMLNHLVDFYQVCSNYAPWAKNGQAPQGSHVYIGLYCIEKT